MQVSSSFGFTNYTYNSVTDQLETYFPICATRATELETRLKSPLEYLLAFHKVGGLYAKNDDFSKFITFPIA